MANPVPSPVTLAAAHSTTVPDPRYNYRGETTSLFDMLAMATNDLDVSVRAANCMGHAGIEFIWQLVEKNEREMLKSKNFGKKSLNELRDLLTEFGLNLGMILEEDLRAALPVRSAELKAAVEAAYPPRIKQVPDPLEHIDAGYRLQLEIYTARRIGLGRISRSALPAEISKQAQRAMDQARQMRAANPWPGVKS